MINLLCKSYNILSDLFRWFIRWFVRSCVHEKESILSVEFFASGGVLHVCPDDHGPNENVFLDGQEMTGNRLRVFVDHGLVSLRQT